MSVRAEHTIGLILANASSSFTTAFMDLFEQALSQKNYRLMVGLTGHDLDKERFYLEHFGKTTEGILILSDASDYSELSDSVPADIPTIFIHRTPENCTCTSVIENDYSATFQAVLLMLHSGYPNIALICRNIKFSTSREIIQAYKAAMKTTSTDFHEEWIFECQNENEVHELLPKITEAGCTGILAASIEITERLAPCVYEYNKVHEHPLSLTGFSTENRSILLLRNLDLIKRPIQHTVDLALQQLFYHLDHPDAPKDEYLVKGTLRMRTKDVFQTLQTTEVELGMS